MERTADQLPPGNPNDGLSGSVHPQDVPIPINFNVGTADPIQEVVVVGACSSETFLRCSLLRQILTMRQEIRGLSQLVFQNRD